jgi:nucleotide-binding universal stress UspA family protein
MLKKILVPLDGSTFSEKAIPYVKELAERFKARVTFLQVVSRAHYVYQNGEVGGSIIPYSDEEMELLNKGVEDYLKEVCQRFEGGGINAESLVTIGTAAEEIVRVAQETDIDLVVMATHGRSGITLWALGSVADKVVKVLKQPIILVRVTKDMSVDPHNGIFNKVLVTLDGSKESEVVLPIIEELASQLEIETILLSVLDMPFHRVSREKLEESTRKYLEGIANKLSTKGIKTKTEIKIGNAAVETINFANEVNADLVAMSTHGHSGINRWYLGSIAQKVLHTGTKPILLVRPS